MPLLPKKSKGITRHPEELMLMFYGPPGIGKSVAASKFPGVCFISTTRGLGWLDVPEVVVTDWDQFQEVCAEIELGKHNYKCFCVDLIRDLYEMAVEYVMAEELGGKHPSEFEWGKGWGACGKEFRRVFSRLMNLKTKANLHYGIIFIAHEDTREIKTKLFKTDKIVPKVSKGTFEWMFGLLDILCYMCMVQSKGEKGVVQRRMMHLAPSVEYEAKSWNEYVPAVVEFEDEDVFKLINGYVNAKPKKRRH